MKTCQLSEFIAKTLSLTETTLFQLPQVLLMAISTISWLLETVHLMRPPLMYLKQCLHQIQTYVDWDLSHLVSFTKPTQIMVAKILHKDSPLQKLVIQRTGNHEGATMVSSIMKALESNTILHFLQVSGIDDHVRVALETGLPKLWGLQELSCHGLHLDEAQQPSMLEAFKHNTSIHKTWGVEEAFPDINDKKKLHHYAMRNENISLLLENPNRVPLSAWPKIFEITQQIWVWFYNHIQCIAEAGGPHLSRESVMEALPFGLFEAEMAILGYTYVHVYNIHSFTLFVLSVWVPIPRPKTMAMQACVEYI